MAVVASLALGACASDDPPAPGGRTVAISVACRPPSSSSDCERKLEDPMRRQCSRDDVVAVRASFHEQGRDEPFAEEEIECP